MRLLARASKFIRTKGCGFYEPVYQECLGIEFEHRGIPAIAQPGMSLEYRGRILTQQYFPDFICYDKIIVELKAVAELMDEHRSQVLNYLKAAQIRAWSSRQFWTLP